MKKYFDGKVSHGFLSIYTSRIIARISVTMMGLFMPIFIYNFFDKNIQLVMSYYIIDRIIYFLILPIGTKFALNKIGIKTSMIISTSGVVLYYVVFYFVNKWMFIDSSIPLGMSNFELTALFTGMSLLLLNARRILYWVPYHTDCAKFTDPKNRARQMSLLEASTMFLNAIMPMVAGWIIFTFNYNVLFAFSIVIYITSAIPLISMPKTEEKFNWSLKKSLKELFSKKRRKMVLAYAGDGAEYIINYVIWPIFIFELLKGNYFQVGALSSLVVIVSIVLQFVVGRFADQGKRDKIIRFGSVFYALGWVIKVFIETAFQIFVASTYHNITRIFTRASFDALYYEKAADEGHFVDEYTVIREMAINIGAAIMFVLVMVITPIVGIQWTFILGAIAALSMNFLIADKKPNHLEGAKTHS